MKSTTSPQASAKKWICLKCIGEKYLSRRLRQSGKERKCSYCGLRRLAVPLPIVCDAVEVAFEHHYQRTSDQPNNLEYMMLSDRESSYEWERHGEPVVYAIMNAAQIPEEAARHIQVLLDEKHYDHEAAKMGDEWPFARDTHYEEKYPDDRTWRREWEEVETSIKKESRHFSWSAARHLTTLFRGINSLRASDGSPVVFDAGPGLPISRFFRARVFQSDGAVEKAICRPDTDVGSPPHRLAVAGRMNAQGVSVFYGATNVRVAIAEVRPPVGSRVVTAKFKLVRPIRLLNLPALENILVTGSIFDEHYVTRLERAAFLRSFGRKITRPVMPDDEAFDYVSTQAIADFLANDDHARLDGIIYRSAQAKDGGPNVVLFHKASRVRSLNLPEGSSVRATLGQYTEEGWDDHCAVFEDIPATTPKPETNAIDDIFGVKWVDDDPRQETLEVDLGSVKVRNVRGVRYRFDTFPVSRTRRVRSSTDDSNDPF